MDLQVGDFCSINRDARFELMKNFSDVVLQVSLDLINLLPSLITSLCERKLAHSSNQKGKKDLVWHFLHFTMVCLVDNFQLWPCSFTVFATGYCCLMFRCLQLCLKLVIQVQKSILILSTIVTRK